MVYEKYLKRIIDLFLASIALIVLLPFFIIISIIIKLDSQGPILFKQLRVGKEKIEFYIYKFRTMKVDTPDNIPTWLLENANSRITRVGKILRKSSLDELPQIINIIKGEMSIIGPRPVIRKEEDLFNQRDQYGVYKVRPGLTGLAQINGRDNITINEKAKLDGHCAKNISLFIDVKIFFLTIVKVFKTEGVKEGVNPSISGNSDVSSGDKLA